MTARSRSSAPDRYAVIGWPLDHTLSPRIHRLFAEQTGERLTYDAHPVTAEALDGFLDDFIASGGRGLNVTVPHKVAVYERFSRARTAAAPAGAPGGPHDEPLRLTLAGAANTLIIDQPGGEVSLDNTDGAGLVSDLTGNLGLDLRGMHILILGAGGAARGVAAPLLDAGCARLIVVNRTADRARALANHVRRLRAFPDDGPPAPIGGGYDLLQDDTRCPRVDLIINATSAGLSNTMPAVPDHLARDAICYDMLYGTDTPFARWARANGAARVALGLGMLVEQAAEAFVRWRGVRPATAPVLARLSAELDK